jgi:hypothetical protein
MGGEATRLFRGKGKDHLNTEQAKPWGATTPLSHPRRTSVWVAQWVSHLASPPLLLLVMATLVAYQERGDHGYYWVTRYILLAAFLPMLYVVRLVRRGEATDIHLPQRQERLRPLLLATAGGLVGFLLLHRGAAPRFLTWLAAAAMVQTGIVLLITLAWKISMHAAAATALAIVAVTLWGIPGVLAVAVLPVVFWARLHLQRHTPAQIVGGALCGALVFGVFFALPYMVH